MDRGSSLQDGKNAWVEVGVSLKQLVLAYRGMPIFLLSGLDIIVVKDGDEVVNFVAVQVSKLGELKLSMSGRNAMPTFYKDKRQGACYPRPGTSCGHRHLRSKTLSPDQPQCRRPG